MKSRKGCCGGRQTCLFMRVYLKAIFHIKFCNLNTYMMKMVKLLRARVRMRIKIVHVYKQL